MAGTRARLTRNLRLRRQRRVLSEHTEPGLVRSLTPRYQAAFRSCLTKSRDGLVNEIIDLGSAAPPHPESQLTRQRTTSRNIPLRNGLELHSVR